MVMMIDVDVEELWTSTVTRMPMVRPVRALERKDSFEKSSPAVFPAAKHL